MTEHRQILDKLAARFLVQALDENFAYAVSRGMGRAGKIESLEEQKIWQKILNRWDAVLQNGGRPKINGLYRQKALLALALTAHKYGLNIDNIRPQALAAIDALNAQVALSDDFERKSPDIKAFLHTPPRPPKRRPPLPENITFYRPQDIIAIRHKQHFYTAYIHEDTGINEIPVIEFYDHVSDTPPTLAEIQKHPARGAHYQDGTTRIARYAVAQMKYHPDPAGQISLIAAAIPRPPSHEHLAPAVGLYQLTDIFTLQNDIEYLFRPA